MRIHFFIIYAFISSVSFAQTKSSHIRLDTCVFEKNMPDTARTIVRQTIDHQMAAFEYHYTDLLLRCKRCRGRVKLELFTDSLGTIDSVQIIHAGTRIIDREFLDAVENQIPTATGNADQRFKTRVVLSFRSPSSTETLKKVSMIALFISLMVSFALRLSFSHSVE